MAEINGKAFIAEANRVFVTSVSPLFEAYKANRTPENLRAVFKAAVDAVSSDRLSIEIRMKRIKIENFIAGHTMGKRGMDKAEQEIAAMLKRHDSSLNLN